jgi:pimeloyl-ACP methyl ester carboxylesterase
MPFITGRDQVQIHYEERGSGPAVLLSHGYRANARMWQHQMDALSDRYHLMAWDMRGHGRSDSPENPLLYSHETAVADMAAIVQACGVKRAVIGGLSLGGFISLSFYLAHPERTIALMLFDTGPGQRKRGSQGLAHAARGMLDEKDDRVIAALSSIQVPTLVLCGAEDKRFLRASDYLAVNIPGAEKVILEGAGHVSNLDKPDEFNAAVRSFLDRVCV